MVVRIKRGSGATGLKTAPKPMSDADRQFGQPHHGHGPEPIKAGAFEVHLQLDFQNETGKTKFLVHRTKPGLWYQIMNYDEEYQTLKLRSVHGTTWPSKVHATTPEKYVLVIGPHDAKEPNEQVFVVVEQLAAAAKAAQ